MTQPVRALLLAAGLGTRLRPITLKTPKCLVPIGGEPLLARWLRKLESAGCDSVLITLLAEKCISQSWKLLMKVQFHEPELLHCRHPYANQGFSRTVLDPVWRE